MKIKCEYIDKDSGCLVSFDGSCCKEECFTYRLMQKLETKEQENKRLLEIINAKPLETVDIDSAFEIEKSKEQLKAKEQECEELKRQYKELGQCSKRMKEYFEKEKETLSNRFLKLKQILAEINEIAEGMHDLWINKTKYTDIDNLVKHLLECELSRIIYKLDEISECEVEE